MQDNNTELRAKADAYAAKALQSLPEGVIYTIVLVAKHLKNGVFWGFTTVDDVVKHEEAIRKDPNIVARKISARDCIIEISPNYIVQNLVSVGNDIFSKGDIDKMQSNMASAVVEFEKFLLNKGIQKEGFGSTIGIYCVNNVTTISYRGVSYPAFRLNMEKTLQLLSKYGYYVKVKGKFVPAIEAMRSGALMWDSAKLSPTKTGVFIDIKSSLPASELKKMKKTLGM